MKELLWYKSICFIALYSHRESHHLYRSMQIQNWFMKLIYRYTYDSTMIILTKTNPIQGP